VSVDVIGGGATRVGVLDDDVIGVISVVVLLVSGISVDVISVGVISG
jgi:hypothetical protein